MAPVPVVLLGDVGQRALAGELERRHVGRLVLLNVGVPRHGGEDIFRRPMAAPATAEEIRDFNVRYHDAAASDYDPKWGIDFGEVGQAQVLTKMRKALGSEPGHFHRSLEIGAGTGYFTLNLVRAGVVDRATCTDISPGMLETLAANAKALGLAVATVRTEAERLPFADQHFDLVFGHAVLHHLPDLAAAFSEFHRVLRPGGTLVFAGEPSRYGDRLAGLPKRAAVTVAPVWRALMGAARMTQADGGPGGDHGLEFAVDVHAFAPGDLGRHARDAGFERVRVRGEELLASWFGWVNRTFEGSANPEQIPWLWRQYAYRGYLLLQQVDRRLLEPRLPPGALLQPHALRAKAGVATPLSDWWRVSRAFRRAAVGLGDERTLGPCRTGFSATSPSSPSGSSPSRPRPCRSTSSRSGT